MQKESERIIVCLFLQQYSRKIINFKEGFNSVINSNIINVITMIT